MTTLQMYDAAYPPASPPGWPVVAGYIGGNTPHVWTDAEWDGQPARRRLPIYVRSNPASHDPAADAAEAVAWLRTHDVPAGCAVALDLETAVNAAYVTRFDEVVLAAGYLTIAYGSLSTLYKNPRPSGGYWVAHYTGAPYSDAGAVATQYASDRQLGHPWDASLINASVPLWDTASPSQEEEDMAQVSSVGAAGTLAVAAGGHADVKWTREFTDKHNLHGDNGVSVVIATETFWCHASAQFEFRGLDAGAKLDVAWTRVQDDGTFIDDPWRKTFTADENGVIRDDLHGQFSVGKANRARLRVYNAGDKALTLTVVATDANEIPVTMAKATLLKF